MAEKTPNPYCFSKSVLSGNGPVEGLARAQRGRPLKVAPVRAPDPNEESFEPLSRTVAGAPGLGAQELPVLVREWLTELRVMGRSPRTLSWYAQRFDLRQPGAVRKLPELNGFELKRFLAEYPVDPSLLRVRPPSVSQKEMHTYTPLQIEQIFTTAKAGWPRMAVQILLGTGCASPRCVTSSSMTWRTTALRPS